jgi:hypothetical protein
VVENCLIQKRNNMATFGKAKKSGGPRKAPKISKYNFDNNYMNESIHNDTRKNPMGPLTKKRLSK